jgi:RHS repeat-associated protein
MSMTASDFCASTVCFPPSSSTGKERDSESGLDYFGARYYVSSMGRWLSPDIGAAPVAVAYSDLGTPQSLNLYGYVQNNPLSRVDSDGHSPSPNGPGGCALEGISIDCGLINRNATVLCPGSCSGFNNSGQFVDYISDGDAEGYVPFYVVAGGFYSWNGIFMVSVLISPLA